jgi:hypothetical protein
MTERIKLVQGDTGPQIRLALTNQATSAPINLTGATVNLNFRAVGAATAEFTRPAFINPDTAINGVCYIDWAPGDLDVEPGDYEGEIEVIQATGARETIYDLLKFRVREEIA